MTIAAVGKTNIGNIRQNNEDNIFISTEPIGKLPNLFIVADGMGGHNAGEIASQSSIDFFCQYLTESKVELDCEGIVMDGIFYANSKIYNKAQIESEKHGMGTTFTMCTIKDNVISIGHVGDSRLYKINENEIDLLTIDHTFVNEMVAKGLMSKEQAEIDPNRNYITRALGIDETIMVDFEEFKISNNDIFLLCSDGLTGMLNDSLIKEIVLENKDLNIAVEKLIENALFYGGKDNVSVVLISVKEA